MQILTKPIKDKRIDAHNVICEMSMREYYELVKDSMKKNVLQRGRVPSAKSIYSLLKDDLITGCIMPPIVLSIFSDFENSHEVEDIKDYIQRNKENLIILDGLQRTFTIQEIYKEYIQQDDNSVLNHFVRVEIYLGLNREGVLYRMLTLNTGQTKMNLRHQIEMIYRDLVFDQKESQIRFLRDDDKGKKDVNTFYFNEAVDAYTSFINGSYLQITREKLLETIESFSELSSLKYKQDAFIDLMSAYSAFLKIVDGYLHDKIKDIEEFGEETDIKPLFGTNAISIFNKSQCLTGYAAAVFRHFQLGTYTDLKQVRSALELVADESFLDSTFSLLRYLNEIRNNSSKIGNAQRCLFYHLFKSLLDKDRDTYLNISKSLRAAIQNYERDL